MPSARGSELLSAETTTAASSASSITVRRIRGTSRGWWRRQRAPSSTRRPVLPIHLRPERRSPTSTTPGAFNCSGTRSICPGSAAIRARPTSYQRFFRLPADHLLDHFDAIDLHRHPADVGWVAADLYDGCLLVEFSTGRLTVVDLDNYLRGPGVNTMGRMFGARRFMAPEEFQLGAPIDQRTTVFTLGRLVWHFATRLTEHADQFCGTSADTVADPAAAWQGARRSHSPRAAEVR